VENDLNIYVSLVVATCIGEWLSEMNKEPL